MRVAGGAGRWGRRPPTRRSVGALSALSPYQSPAHTPATSQVQPPAAPPLCDQMRSPDRNAESVRGSVARTWTCGNLEWVLNELIHTSSRPCALVDLAPSEPLRTLCHACCQEVQQAQKSLTCRGCNLGL